ncbi:glycoside hydrolase family 7 [Rhizoctonia solani]|uniref:Glucanase n=1 Tax=Rhizoctonia solani TaxID=456999 RepID=A0A8H7ICM3_9AGAM|nr:glycoside hydrolase family 7 [Rhizoctonia solani]
MSAIFLDWFFCDIAVVLVVAMNVELCVTIPSTMYSAVVLLLSISQPSRPSKSAPARLKSIPASLAEMHQVRGCVTQSSGKVVLDANWRWVHTTTGYTNCYTGQKWDTSICTDAVTCAKNCAVDVRVIQAQEPGVHFDVDVSNLPCGLNGALYFSEMDADGGMSKYPNNKAGAKYGTGYCDAQCPKDIKFINGEANVVGWNGAPNDPNSGTGSYGTCCTEMDIWEANSMATHTPLTPARQRPDRCTGSECSSICDQPGCDFNSYRMGDKSFYGKGLTIDTNKKITVVTQFITSDGTANGALTEIRRIYVQDGKVIQNSKTNVAGMDTYDSITDKFCAAQKTAFNDENVFANKGGLSAMDKSFTKGHVLVSTTPSVATPTLPELLVRLLHLFGVPDDVEKNSPNASVTFSNIKFGDIGSTYGGSTVPPLPLPPALLLPHNRFFWHCSSLGSMRRYGYTGPTVCQSPYTCVKNGDYYSQCL